MKKPVTLQQAIAYFADADRCFDYAKFLRWPDGKVTCPRCESASNSFVKTRRLWFCNGCKKQFTVKVGTIFEDSPIGLDKWMAAVWMICNCKNGISSYELHRSLGITQKTAWFMLHRIREAMKSGDFTRMGSGGGPVEVDEAYIGGTPKNMHMDKRQKLMDLYGERPPKPAVIGMLDRETRQIRTKVLPKIERGTLMAEVLNGVKHGIPLYTDSHAGYSAAQRWFVLLLLRSSLLLRLLLRFRRFWSAKEFRHSNFKFFPRFFSSLILNRLHSLPHGTVLMREPERSIA